MGKFSTYPQASYVVPEKDYLLMAQGAAGDTKKLNIEQLCNFTMSVKRATINYVGDPLYLDVRNPFNKTQFLHGPFPIFLWTAVDEPGACEFYLINVFDRDNGNLYIDVHTFFDQSGNPYQHGQKLCAIDVMTNYNGDKYVRIRNNVHNDFFGTSEVDLTVHVWSPWNMQIYDMWDIS